MSCADALSVHRSPRTLAYAGERCTTAASLAEPAHDVRPPAPSPAPVPTSTESPSSGASAASGTAGTPAPPAVRQAARARATADTAPRAAAVHAQARAGEVHWPLTVQPGDSLFQIAARYRRPDGSPRSSTELLAHNPQLQSRPDLIHPGEVLRIPRSWVFAAPPSSTPVRRHAAPSPAPSPAPPPASPRSSASRSSPVKALRAAPVVAPVPVTAPAPTAVSAPAPVPAPVASRPTIDRGPAVGSAPTAPASSEAVDAAPDARPARSPTHDALWGSIVALGPVAAHPGNVYEQAIVGNTTAEGLQRFVDGALDTLARRQDDAMARSTWTRNLRIALGRAATLGVDLR